MYDTASVLPSPSHHIAPGRSLMPSNVAAVQGLQLSSPPLSTVPHRATTPTALILPHVCFFYCLLAQFWLVRQ